MKIQCNSGLCADGASICSHYVKLCCCRTAGEWSERCDSPISGPTVDSETSDILQTADVDTERTGSPKSELWTDGWSGFGNNRGGHLADTLPSRGGASQGRVAHRPLVELKIRSASPEMGPQNNFVTTKISTYIWHQLHWSSDSIGHDYN